MKYFVWISSFLAGAALVVGSFLNATVPQPLQWARQHITPLGAAADFGALHVSPNTLPVCNGQLQGAAQFTWEVPTNVPYEVRVGSESGSVVASGVTGNGTSVANPVVGTYKLYTVRTQVLYQLQYIRGRGWVRVPVSHTIRELVGEASVYAGAASCGTGSGRVSGWDPGLVRRCVKTAGAAGSSNYFEDVMECAGAGRGNWTAVVQSEQQPGVSCPGPNNQSFAINGSNSPTSMQWLDHVSASGLKNHTVRLTTDFMTQAHPCGAGYFTFNAFMDHANHGGGPLPRPDRVRLSSELHYTEYLPAAASRITFGFQGWWNGGAHVIEVDAHTTSNWGDGSADEAIVNAAQYPDFQFIHVAGRAVGVSVTPGRTDTVTIDWLEILRLLQSKGLLELPADWSQSATQAVYIATEMRNDKPQNAGITNLWFTDFTVTER